MIAGSAEHKKHRGPSLYLSAPRLTALREELSTLQTALRCIQPRVDPAALRLVRQFHAQLSASTAILNVSGTPGAGVSTLTRLLAGDQGGPPRRDGQTAIHRQTRAPVLPVRLTELSGLTAALDKTRSLTIRLAENNLALVVLRADRLLGAIDFSLVRLLREQIHHPMILFVNQIDLLDDPAPDMARIRAQIDDLIARHHQGTAPPSSLAACPGPRRRNRAVCPPCPMTEKRRCWPWLKWQMYAATITHPALCGNCRACRI